MMQKDAVKRKKYTKPKEFPLAALPAFEEEKKEEEQQQQEHPGGAAQQQPNQ